MTLFLNNADQIQCLKVANAVERLNDGLRQWAMGDAVRRPRIDAFLPTGRANEFFCFSSMDGGTREPGYYALRIKPEIVIDDRNRRLKYSGRPGLWGGLVLLYSTKNAELLAIMNDGHVQHVRVAATAGLGIRYLARKNSRVLGMLGTGGMAHLFAEVARAERPIERVQVYSPTPANREAYCTEMRTRLGCEVLPMESAEAAVQGVDILCLCTNSRKPVINAEWIKPGMHVTHVSKWEMDDASRERVDAVGELVKRSPLRLSGFVDDDFDVRMDAVMSYAGGQPDERAQLEVTPRRESWYPNGRVVACCDWKTGQPYARRPDEITILANQGFGVLEGDAGSSSGFQGIQFACSAGQIYERAVELGLGQVMPTEMFLQDIPT